MIAQIDRATDASTEKIIKSSVVPYANQLDGLLDSTYGKDPEVREIVSNYRTKIVQPWSMVRGGSANTQEGVSGVASNYRKMYDEVNSFIKDKYNLEEPDPNSPTTGLYSWQWVG